MNPKICHLTSVHKSNDSRIFEKECKSLTGVFDVNLVVLNGVNEVKNNIKIHSTSCTIQNKILKRLIGAYKTYSLAKSINADIYHIHDPELIPFGILLKTKKNIIIFDSHEDLPQQIFSKYYLPLFSRKIISKLIDFLETKFLKKYNLVISATPDIAKKFLQKKIPSIAICNYPVQINKNYILKNFDQKEFDLVYHGAITIKRGIKELLMSINKVENSSVKLALAGVFQPQNLEAELNISTLENVTYFNQLPKNEIINLLNNSKIGIVTLLPTSAYQTSLPIKMFEYMQMGLPVIASNFKLWEEIILENNCGLLVNPDKPGEIADSINYLLSNPKIATQMGKKGQEAIERKYNWEVESIKLVTAYNELLKK